MTYESAELQEGSDSHRTAQAAQRAALLRLSGRPGHLIWGELGNFDHIEAEHYQWRLWLLGRSRYPFIPRDVEPSTWLNHYELHSSTHPLAPEVVAKWRQAVKNNQAQSNREANAMWAPLDHLAPQAATLVTQKPSLADWIFPADMHAQPGSRAPLASAAGVAAMLEPATTECAWLLTRRSETEPCALSVDSLIFVALESILSLMGCAINDQGHFQAMSLGEIASFSPPTRWSLTDLTRPQELMILRIMRFLVLANWRCPVVRNHSAVGAVASSVGTTDGAMSHRFRVWLESGSRGRFRREFAQELEQVELRTPWSAQASRNFEHHFDGSMFEVDDPSQSSGIVEEGQPLSAPTDMATRMDMSDSQLDEYLGGHQSKASIKDRDASPQSNPDDPMAKSREWVLTWDGLTALFVNSGGLSGSSLLRRGWLLDVAALRTPQEQGLEDCGRLTVAKAADGDLVLSECRVDVWGAWRIWGRPDAAELALHPGSVNDARAQELGGVEYWKIQLCAKQRVLAPSLGDGSAYVRLLAFNDDDDEISSDVLLMRVGAPSNGNRFVALTLGNEGLVRHGNLARALQSLGVREPVDGEFEPHTQWQPTGFPGLTGLSDF